MSDSRRAAAIRDLCAREVSPKQLVQIIRTRRQNAMTQSRLMPEPPQADTLLLEKTD